LLFRGEGMRAGTREAVGDFYALTWRDAEDKWHRILDPLAMSLPFGAMAPAELYDVAAMQAARGDAAYFEALRGPEVHKFGPPTNILQVHVPTATAGGTIASLTRHVPAPRRTRRPTCRWNRRTSCFWAMTRCSFCRWSRPRSTRPGPISGRNFRRDSEMPLPVDLLRPDTTNWGYDVVIAGMAAREPGAAGNRPPR
jgi:hypothetical protein